MFLGSQEIEHGTKLGVSSFRGHKIVETRDGVQRGDGAAVIRWDATARMSDQEREVELREDRSGNDGGVSLLGGGGIGVWCLVAVTVAIRIAVGYFGVAVAQAGRAGLCTVSVMFSVAVGITLVGAIALSVCSHSLLDSLPNQRWGDCCWFAFRRNEIVGDILDEETPVSLDVMSR